MTRTRRAALLAPAALCAAGSVALRAAEAPAPVHIAVFAFELVDATPSQELLGKSTSETGTLAKVSQAAREQLEQSGRYRVIDASQATDKRLGDCDGCEAALALKLGADQSLLGVVKRVTQTDYYVLIQIRDAHTGKLLDQQGANFAGSEEGWASGVRVLIRHQILAPPE